MKIIVCDIYGNEFAFLVYAQKSAGEYEVTFDGSDLPSGRQGLSSGIYYYQLTFGDFVKTNKMVYLK